MDINCFKYLAWEHYYKNQRETFFYDKDDNVLDTHVCDLTDDGRWELTSKATGAIPSSLCPYRTGNMQPKCVDCQTL